MNALLSIDGVSKRFRGLLAVDNASFRVTQGSIFAVIGPNGAGKTTLINLLTGVFPPTAGDVFLDEEKVSGLAQHQRVKRGMTRTFQINTLFPGLTVLESITLACCERAGAGAVWWRTAATATMQIDEAREILARLRLEGDAGVETRNLPYGKQRLLEIALALATRPKVLLLDEPAAGIPSAESAELFAVIAALPRDVSIIFIEHDMNLVFKFAEKITVLVGGTVLVEGAPDEIARDKRVREVYLGEALHA
jgi:branched-chain amino acid transport system ATP-binding protein